MQRFSRRGAESVKETEAGVVTTNWQFQEAVIKQRAITRRRREQREGVTSWRRTESESLFDKPKVGEIQPKGFEQYLRGLEREIKTSYDTERKQAYLENYIQSLKEQLGAEADEIKTLLRGMPIDNFITN